MGSPSSSINSNLNPYSIALHNQEDPFAIALKNNGKMKQEILGTFVNSKNERCTLEEIIDGDRNTLESYYSICHEFHLRGYHALENKPLPLPQFLERLKAKLTENVKLYLEKKLDFILVYSDRNVVAGTFFSKENDQADHRIQAFSFNRDDLEEDKELYSQQMIDHISNSFIFRDLERVTVMVRDGERNLEYPLLKKAGFNIVEEEYPNDYIPAHFKKMERIVRK